MNEQFFEDVIVEIISFDDGSRIIIKVQVLAEKEHTMDSAHAIFYSLRDRLNAIWEYAAKGKDKSQWLEQLSTLE